MRRRRERRGFETRDRDEHTDEKEERAIIIYHHTEKRSTDFKATFKRLVIAFVISRIDYCNSIFKGISHEKIKRLQGIQNQTAELVKLAHTSDHVTPILKDLHWLPAQSRIDYKILTLVFRSTQDQKFPAYLKHIIEMYLPERSLRSKTKNLLKRQRPKLKTFGYRSFYFTTPERWNTLPKDILKSSSVLAY